MLSRLIAADISVGPRNTASADEPYKKRQRVCIKVSDTEIQLSVNQSTWDALSEERKKDALGLLDIDLQNHLFNWASNWVDVIDILAGLKTINGDDK